MLSEKCVSRPGGRTAAKASSRLGPTFATEPAAASAWHPAHLLMKSALPFATSPLFTGPPVPQPAAASAKANATGATRRARKVYADGWADEPSRSRASSRVG